MNIVNDLRNSEVVRSFNEFYQDTFQGRNADISIPIISFALAKANGISTIFAAGVGAGSLCVKKIFDRDLVIRLELHSILFCTIALMSKILDKAIFSHLRAEKNTILFLLYVVMVLCTKMIFDRHFITEVALLKIACSVSFIFSIYYEMGMGGALKEETYYFLTISSMLCFYFTVCNQFLSIKKVIYIAIYLMGLIIALELY